MTTYGDKHRSFLRQIWSRGVVSETDALKILDKLGSDAPLAEFVRQANEKLRRLKQEIKVVSNEADGRREVVFVSYGDDEASRAQSRHSPAETEYFKCVLDEIVTARSKSVTGIEALNLVAGVQSGAVTKSQAQELLDQWVAEYYFKKGIRNGYGLGTRGICEFETYFKKNFTGVVENCMLCKRGLYRIQIECPHCEERGHVFCLKSSTQKIKKWPCCKAAFDDKEFEKAVEAYRF